MTWTRWCMVAYGVLMALLGILGSIKAHEVPSLIGGVGAGALVVGCMFWSLKTPRPGYIAALILAVLFGGYFSYNFLVKTHLFYPHGIIALLNIFLIFALLGGHMITMAMKKSEGTPLV